MYEVKGRLKVHLQHSIPLLLRHAKKQTVLGDTGIIDQDVNMSEVFHDLLHQLMRLSKVRGITGIRYTFHAQRLYFCPGGFR